ncbi:HU family DNA-binding protein [Streptomyces sp. LP05-1]|uniref:HU family DNA-binding protein n=1 Tax=Streptomyces pyxinae TaxID=2970734 RepID=A0ABT2CN53_9ACTN|nr:HU family DNA-binding protein [Streptomyces sp. LP05-1]MCS0638676.1 HU family DNA-binding protein [Streptomyces sp. LP05-1]
MDKDALTRAVAAKTGNGGGGRALEPAVVGRVLDALFGTVERPGALAEGLREGGAVSVLGFGDFHVEDGRAVLRPGKALTEFLAGETRR